MARFRPVCPAAAFGRGLESELDPIQCGAGSLARLRAGLSFQLLEKPAESRLAGKTAGPRRTTSARAHHLEADWILP